MPDKDDEKIEEGRKPQDGRGPAREADPSRERATPTEHTGSPFPDPDAPKSEGNVEVVPGQPVPSPDNPGDGARAQPGKDI
jgi:hypothetical protein